MVNDKRFELNEVKSPLLNPDFGNGLEEQFENIDANFKKIASAEYLRGRSGTTTHCFTIKLNRDDNGDTGIWYKNNDEAGQPVYVTPTNILNKLEQAVGQTIEPTIDEQGNVNYPELILFVEDDNQGHKRTVSSMPFIYHDPELVDLLNDKDYQGQDFQDNSGIFLFNGDYFEKATSYPTLYYNKEIGEFCWIINGTETELVARGPQGIPGQNGMCLVVQIEVMSNNNNDSLPFGEQEIDVDGNKINVPLMYPIKAIMLPDMETGFAWKKLEDFTDDDPVTNYLHNNQIVIAIPNGGNEIELANDNGYSAITWACISPIITKAGNMFEGGGTDYFFVYANYSNSISNIVSNTNLKWILRSVNINSNDLKGLYVSNNPTDIENIEYSPDSTDYEQTYFPNGVHMAYVDENNILNFKHTTKPESTEKFGGNSKPSVNFDYHLSAETLRAKDYIMSKNIYSDEDVENSWFEWVGDMRMNGDISIKPFPLQMMFTNDKNGNTLDNHIWIDSGNTLTIECLGNNSQLKLKNCITTGNVSLGTSTPFVIDSGIVKLQHMLAIEGGGAYFLGPFKLSTSLERSQFSGGAIFTDKEIELVNGNEIAKGPFDIGGSKFKGDFEIENSTININNTGLNVKGPATFSNSVTTANLTTTDDFVAANGLFKVFPIASDVIVGEGLFIVNGVTGDVTAAGGGFKVDGSTGNIVKLANVSNPKIQYKPQITGTYTITTHNSNVITITSTLNLDSGNHTIYQLTGKIGITYHINVGASGFSTAYKTFNITNWSQNDQMAMPLSNAITSNTSLSKSDGISDVSNVVIDKIELIDPEVYYTSLGFNGSQGVNRWNSTDSNGNPIDKIRGEIIDSLVLTKQ